MLLPRKLSSVELMAKAREMDRQHARRYRRWVRLWRRMAEKAALTRPADGASE